MEKLIELLNEYQYWVFVYENEQLRFRMWSKVKIWAEPILISKSFWFIKWLVENDKIDDDKCDIINEIYNDELPSKYTRYDGILMWLAIQDNPIEFLISILK